MMYETYKLIVQKSFDTFIKYRDKLDIGLRQQLALTVNNRLQYHLGIENEQKVYSKVENYKMILNLAVCKKERVDLSISLVNNKGVKMPN